MYMRDHDEYEPLGVITQTELDEARQDPFVHDLLEDADRYLAELERDGLSRGPSAV